MRANRHGCPDQTAVPISVLVDLHDVRSECAPDLAGLSGWTESPFSHTVTVSSLQAGNIHLQGSNGQSRPENFTFDRRNI